MFYCLGKIKTFKTQLLASKDFLLDYATFHLNPVCVSFLYEYKPVRVRIAL